MCESQNGPVVSYETWIAAITSSTCIGFTSLVPWLFNMTFFEHAKNGNHCKGERMKFLLSFAVGAILGDIFFHLIPESFHSYLVELNESEHVAYKKVGASVVAGIFMFIIVEMILERWSNSFNGCDTDIVLNFDKNDKSPLQEAIPDAQVPIFIKKDLEQTGSLMADDRSRKFLENNNNIWSDLNLAKEKKQGNQPVLREADIMNNNNSNHITDRHLKLRKNIQQETQQMMIEEKVIDKSKANDVDKFNGNIPKECQPIDTAGYLSLVANGFDNFTHGLAIGASFLVGPKVGLLTTFVIFIHEIPHEICDYAILVNSGFSRWNAVKAQSSVSLFGILGTATALCVKSVQTLNAKTIWILPFSAGGFLYIALVNLLPEILDRKTDVRNSLGQIACVILGIAFMASVAVI